MFFLNVTSSTVHHGALPSWFRTVKRMANPFWSCRQLYSRRLPSASTRRAFFSSKRFLTDHGLPPYVGCPIFQDSGLKKWLRRISISEGTRSGIDGSAPP